jgi:TonB family protein
MHCAALLVLILSVAGTEVAAPARLLLLASPRASQQVPAQPNPDASGKYHIGDGVSAPKLIYAPDPEYTSKARRKKLTGRVLVSLTVDTTGKPRDLRISRSLADQVSQELRSAALTLDESALKTVKAYRFKPAEFAGRPVPVEIKVEVNYQIN